MTGFRRVLVNCVLAGMVLGHVYDIARDQEHWPFSQYPMFRTVWRSPTFTHLRLRGVTRDGTEFPLDANRFITPFDMSRLPKALGMIVRSDDGQERVKLALRDCYNRYEALRRANKHEGPPLVGLRLYEMEWTIDREARNVDTPDRRSFIAEVRASDFPAQSRLDQGYLSRFFRDPRITPRQ